MKKLMFIACLLVASISAQAQFEHGKWVVNPSLTGLDLSYNKNTKTTFGFNALAGAFLVDNVALLVNLGAEWAKNEDVYSLGVGGRYYFDKIGLYTGAGLKMNRFDPDYSKKVTDFAVSGEVGYAFFITKTVTVEPAVYCDLSLKDSDYTRFGLKVGFGIYF
ncbi:outer membrane beta-barrel protein [Bacteroides sp. 224]|uniref:outer membrane beta-barrel protein n=1 Tax=Bacteroides sp. 224 TaxID=2302936 RepID=UPI0013D13706|nr:outer membrane beta-barrel protein [Bacteroides sp. 224]NDV66144.1 hypothetical protein [Bacteroides sp. 224]